MARYEFTMQRLYVTNPLIAETEIELSADQAHYVLTVLRMREGAGLLLFNGTDGEWRAEIARATKRGCTLRLAALTRAQEGGCDIHYLFAPIKRARLDFMVEKATELGVAKLQPVITRFTQAERVNLTRLRANVIEAAEQCGVLRIPEIAEPVKLGALIAAWPPDRHLIYCDEHAAIADPIAALSGIGRGQPLAVLIGPEGGFAPEERALLLDMMAVTPIAMGPRIMRADTAAIAALTLVNAVLGDWG